MNHLHKEAWREAVRSGDLDVAGLDLIRAATPDEAMAAGPSPEAREAWAALVDPECAREEAGE